MAFQFSQLLNTISMDRGTRAGEVAAASPKMRHHENPQTVISAIILYIEYTLLHFCPHANEHVHCWHNVLQMYNICRINKKAQLIKNLSYRVFHEFLKFLATQQLTELSDFRRESGWFLFALYCSAQRFQFIWNCHQ